MVPGKDGLIAGVPYVASPNCDERPVGTAVCLLVVHAISLPPGRFGGDSVERLFTNRLDSGADPYFREIHNLRVSAHFLVRRDGELVQFVAPTRRTGVPGAPVRRVGAAASAAMTSRLASNWKAVTINRSRRCSTASWRN